MKAASVKPVDQSIVKLRAKLLYTYLGFLIIYALFTLLPSPSPALLRHYKIDALTLRLLDSTILIILAGIWFAGFYGYFKLYVYSRLIYKDRDGKNVEVLRKGLLLLVLWLPISSVISAILKYISLKHVGLTAASIIVNNYINLILAFAAFIYIGQGAKGLMKFTRQHASYRSACVLAAFLVYIGAIYTHLVISTKNRSEVYHLSLWLLLITFIAPYVFMWFIGLVATYEIYGYQRKVAGIVYRKSWRFLGLGIGWLILTSIAFQFVTTLSSRLGNLSLYWLLAVVYTLLLLLSFGFILIAIGARKLQKLEEV